MSTQTVVTIDTEAFRRVLEPSVETGQATAGGALTLTDASKNWPVDAWQDLIIEITEGTGKGQIRKVVSNTATVITVDAAWVTIPDATSHYRIGLYGVVTGSFTMAIEDGKADVAGVGILTLTDNQKNWNINMWAGYNVRIVSGTGAGSVRKIVSNTATVLTVNAIWTVGVDSRYIIYPAPLFDATGIQSMNVANVAGTAQTGDDWTRLFQGIAMEYGAATNNALANLQDTTKNWNVDIFEGKLIRMLTGPAAGDVRRIQSNDVNNIYPLTNFSAACGVGSRYVIYDDVGFLPDIIPINPTLSRLVPLAKQTEEGIATVLAVGNTLTDALKFWDVNMWTGHYVRVVSGTGAGQVRIIASNTLNVLTLTNAWAAQPTTDSKYIIFQISALDPTGIQKTNSVIDSGTASAGGAADLTDVAKAWGTNTLVGCYLKIVSGTGAGNIRLIISNTGVVIIVNQAWGVAPDATSKYIILSPPNNIMPNELFFTPARVMEEGYVEAGSGVNTLVSSAIYQRDWGVNRWAGYMVRMINTAGSYSEVRRIISNTINTLTVDSNWGGGAPPAGAQYVIFFAPLLLANGSQSQNIASVNGTAQTAEDWTVLLRNIDEGTASGGAAATITDAAKNWDVNMWAGCLIRVVSGTGINQVRRIISNTATVITVAAWNIAPVAGDRYVIKMYEAALKADGAVGLPDVVKVVGGYDGANVRAVLTDASGNLQVVGSIAHDAADSGKPVKIGGRARTTQIAQVAENDRVDALFDSFARLLVTPGTSLLVATLDKTAIGDADLIAAPGAGIKIRVRGFAISSEGTEVTTAKIKATIAAAANTIIFHQSTDDQVGSVVMLPGYIDCDAATALEAELTAASTNGVLFTVYYELITV
ncbi:MAG: hypothetical protein V1701_02940 [Planctomycetota bacterium]